MAKWRRREEWWREVEGGGRGKGGLGTHEGMQDTQIEGNEDREEGGDNKLGDREEGN